MTNFGQGSAAFRPPGFRFSPKCHPGISIALWGGTARLLRQFGAYETHFEFKREAAMREIIRPETLWREVIPIGSFLLVVLIIFLIALFADREDIADASSAVQWTMGFVGAIVSIVATFGLFWRALNGDPLEAQFGFVLSLLAGLLLVGVHWSLAIALGVIGVALIAREIWGRRLGGASTSAPAYSSADRTMP
jgi:hypothetical protein